MSNRSAFSVTARILCLNRTIGCERSNKCEIEVHLVLELGFVLEKLGVKDQASVKLKVHLLLELGFVI